MLVKKKTNALKRQVLLVLKKNKISEFTSGCRFLLYNIFSYECKRA